MIVSVRREYTQLENLYKIFRRGNFSPYVHLSLSTFDFASCNSVVPVIISHLKEAIFENKNKVNDNNNAVVEGGIAVTNKIQSRM